MFILLPSPDAGTNFNPSDEEYLRCVKDMIGDDSIPAEILGVSKWLINETVAEYYSDGNMFVPEPRSQKFPRLHCTDFVSVMQFTAIHLSMA